MGFVSPPELQNEVVSDWQEFATKYRWVVSSKISTWICVKVCVSDRFWSIQDLKLWCFVTNSLSWPNLPHLTDNCSWSWIWNLKIQVPGWIWLVYTFFSASQPFNFFRIDFLFKGKLLVFRGVPPVLVPSSPCPTWNCSIKSTLAHMTPHGTVSERGIDK